MSANAHSQVTILLDEIRAGRPEAADQLAKVVYRELERIAGKLLKHERAGHTLQPSDLVQEAFVRLLGADALAKAKSRSYFFAAASRAMRRILVEHARAHSRLKRGGERQRVPLDAVLDYFAQQRLDLVALGDALDELATLHPRQHQAVEMRYFGGQSVAEIAELLEVCVSTVEADLRMAKAFLHLQVTTE